MDTRDKNRCAYIFLPEELARKEKWTEILETCRPWFPQIHIQVEKKKHRKNKLYSDKFGKFCIRLEKDAARVEKYNFREVCCFENSRADKTECANQGK